MFPGARRQHVGWVMRRGQRAWLPSAPCSLRSWSPLHTGQSPSSAGKAEASLPVRALLPPGVLNNHLHCSEQLCLSPHCKEDSRQAKNTLSENDSIKGWCFKSNKRDHMAEMTRVVFLSFLVGVGHVICGTFRFIKWAINKILVTFLLPAARYLV